MLWHPCDPGNGTIGLHAENADATITIGPVRRPWHDFVTETPWALARRDERRGGVTMLTCSVMAYATDDNGLSDFLARASTDFRGWKGERIWSALENVDLTAVNRGRGRVEFVLTLRETADPDSAVISQPFEMEAGESLDRLSALVAILFSSHS